MAKRARRNPMIPLDQTDWRDAPVLPAPVPLAHWTSFPPGFTKPYYPRYRVDGYYEDFAPARNNPALRKVPAHLPATPRSNADGISAVGGARNRNRGTPWPIGDLYHARLALVYLLSGRHKDVQRKVAYAVQSHYPDYDWASWWNARRGDLPTWSQLMGRAYSNPLSSERFDALMRRPSQDVWEGSESEFMQMSSEQLVRLSQMSPSSFVRLLAKTELFHRSRDASGAKRQAENLTAPPLAGEWQAVPKAPRSKKVSAPASAPVSPSLDPLWGSNVNWSPGGWVTYKP